MRTVHDALDEMAELRPTNPEMLETMTDLFYEAVALNFNRAVGGCANLPYSVCLETYLSLCNTDRNTHEHFGDVTERFFNEYHFAAVEASGMCEQDYWEKCRRTADKLAAGDVSAAEADFKNTPPGYALSVLYKLKNNRDTFRTFMRDLDIKNLARAPDLSSMPDEMLVSALEERGYSVTPPPVPRR